MSAPLRPGDRLIVALEQGLRSLAPDLTPVRASPAAAVAEPALGATERRTSAALMRVNHAGEIAAQALYLGQSLSARSAAARRQLLDAAAEERDHLAWCAQRLRELDARPSLLGPAWFAGSFLIGLAAGLAGDEVSLGFVAETERQVEAHLGDHLERLPQADTKSTKILQQMASDEARHGADARAAGGSNLPAAVRSLMSLGGSMLRTIALRV
jgi:ubiquinone biosynthesis monooxygenase Coq7